MSVPTIKTPRQARAIQALLQRDVSSFEMPYITGVLNPYQLVKNLREQGWSIACVRTSVVDRDGRKCQPGIYCLAPEMLQIGREVLVKFKTEAAVTASWRRPENKQRYINTGGEL